MAVPAEALGLAIGAHNAKGLEFTHKPRIQSQYLCLAGTNGRQTILRTRQVLFPEPECPRQQTKVVLVFGTCQERNLIR